MSKEIVCDICKEVMGKPTDGFVIYREYFAIGCWQKKLADVCDKCVRGMLALQRKEG